MRRLLAFFGFDAGGFGGGRRSGREAPAMIGVGMKVKGEIRGEGSLTVLGQFEGDIVLDGTLHVGPEGRVDANITARAIVVGGIVRGNLSADTRVEILPTGALTGSVKSSRELVTVAFPCTRTWSIRWRGALGSNTLVFLVPS